jgi:hypothetical protein
MKLCKLGLTFFIAKDLQIHVLPKVLYNPKRLEIIKIKKNSTSIFQKVIVAMHSQKNLPFQLKFHSPPASFPCGS